MLKQGRHRYFMKIKEEHLKTIREQQIKINNLLNQIGYISAQEHSLLHDFTTASQEAKDFEKVLEKEYGEVHIDLETGEYKPIEGAESNLKKKANEQGPDETIKEDLESVEGKDE